MQKNASFAGLIFFSTMVMVLLITIALIDSKPTISGYAASSLNTIDSISYSASEFQNAQYEADYKSKKSTYEIVDKYAEQYDISFNLVRAIIRMESSWKHTTSPNNKGAVGIMQLRTTATDDMRNEEGACSDFCRNLKVDRNNLDDNIHGGICYLACQKERFGIYNSPKLIIAAYKEGPSAVDKKCITCWFCKQKTYDVCTSKLDSITVDYVSDVATGYEDYASNSQMENNKDIASGSKIVVVDAGHGGKDTGATSSSGYPEKTVTLAIAKELETQLKQQGINVIMTRNSDVYPTLTERVEIANSNNANLFISIHANSAKTKPCSANGPEVWSYDSAKSKEMAKSVVDEISTALNANNRGTKTTSNLYVLKKTKMPAILVEVGFICNQGDFNIITNPSKQRQIAAAISQSASMYA
ncbi:MAG: N-acetylmuramoyl-L-alanine amidase [archaeon]